MVNACVVLGCKRGSEREDKGNGHCSTFRFPLRNADLLIEWEKFVNRTDWKASENSVICDRHFEETFVSRGKRNRLKWELNPIPTIHVNEQTRCYEGDEINTFRSGDVITDFQMLNESHAPEGFKCNHSEDSIVFYRLVFDETTNFPRILETIKIVS